ncbi:unnamed protein product, partial [Rotaria sp. Silwood1]
MASSELSSKETLVRIDIDGEKYRLAVVNSSTVAELRTILSKRCKLSSSTRFLDAEGCILFPEDEKLVTISALSTENHFVRLTSDKSKITPLPIPEMNSKVFERKIDLTYAQPLSHLSEAPLRELTIPGSTPTPSQNKITVATDLDLDTWKRIFRNCNLFQAIRMDQETPIRAFKPVFKLRQSIDEISLFHVTDESHIKSYMKDKEMHSSFLSSKFFDGGVEFSTPFVGIGVNAEYSKSKTITKIQKKIYLTHCFNFPRVAVELDLSYLEPTSHFIEAIDSVFSFTLDEQVTKLKEVLSTYGHVYPRLVILGGHLYHTEMHDNKEQAEEAKKRLSASASFSASFMQPAKVYAGGGYEKQSHEKSLEQTSFMNLEAVGGDTTYSRDPTLWARTVTNPFLWRIIEQDNYQFVITLLDHQRQQKIQRIVNHDTIPKRVKNIDESCPNNIHPRLQYANIDGIYVNPASPGVTPIWYFYSPRYNVWFWTPYENFGVWMPVHTLTVKSGYYKGEQPAPTNRQ